VTPIWLADKQAWKDVIVPKPYPREFRDDAVRVARDREDGATLDRVAADFGIHPMTFTKWMRQADIDEGNKPGTTRSESDELRELPRRNRWGRRDPFRTSPATTSTTLRSPVPFIR
jgi:transposase